MERELIEALEAHRAALKREVAGPGFASRPTRNQTLTELLALDRLLATMERGTREETREGR